MDCELCGQTLDVLEAELGFLLCPACAESCYVNAITHEPMVPPERRCVDCGAAIRNPFWVRCTPCDDAQFDAWLDATYPPKRPPAPRPAPRGCYCQGAHQPHCARYQPPPRTFDANRQQWTREYSESYTAPILARFRQRMGC